MSPVLVARWLLVAGAIWRNRGVTGSSFYYENLRCDQYLTSEIIKLDIRGSRTGSLEIHVRDNLMVGDAISEAGGRD